MWWIKGDKNPDRGGFQDRDIGRSNFRENLGPEYGVDYALYVLPPDPAADQEVKHRVEERIGQWQEHVHQLEIVVRNGFVVLKGKVAHEDLRSDFIEVVRSVPGVREVINEIQLPQ